MQLSFLFACSQVLPSPTATVTSVKAAPRTNSRAGAAAYRGRNGLLGLEPVPAAASASARQPAAGSSHGRMQKGDAAWSSPRRASQQGNLLGRRPTLSMAAATPRGGDSGGRGGSAAGGADGNGTVPGSLPEDSVLASGSQREGPQLKARISASTVIDLLSS